MSATGIKSDGGLEAMIASMRALEQGMTAAEVAPDVDAYMRGKMAAGQTPEGQDWQKTKDGRTPLRGAAKDYEQRVSGNAIVMLVKGRHAFHHFGAQGQPVRRQLPEGALPARLGDAIRAGAVTWFKAKTKAGKRGYAYYRKRGKNPRAVK